MRPACWGTQPGCSAADIIITRTVQTAALLSLVLNSNIYFEGSLEKQSSRQHNEPLMLEWNETHVTRGRLQTPYLGH